MVSRLDRPNPPCVKKERNFKEVLIHNHSQQIFSADFFSRSSQQIFSADFLQQIFSADLLSRSSQQIFSQQIFSADLLSRFFQQIFSADLLSRFSSITRVLSHLPRLRTNSESSVVAKSQLAPPGLRLARSYGRTPGSFRVGRPAASQSCKNSSSALTQTCSKGTDQQYSL